MWRGRRRLSALLRRARPAVRRLRRAHGRRGARHSVPIRIRRPAGSARGVNPVIVRDRLRRQYRSGNTRAYVPTPTVPQILCVLCVLCCLMLPFQARAELMAGAAKVSITPDPKAMPYPLGGYGDPERLGHPATGVHDTCYARALVLSDGTAKCAIVSLDLCFLPANFKSAVMNRLEAT